MRKIVAILGVIGTLFIGTCCGCRTDHSGDASENPVYPEFTPWWVDNTMNTNENAQIVYPD